MTAQDYCNVLQEIWAAINAYHWQPVLAPDQKFQLFLLAIQLRLRNEFIKCS